MRRYRDRPRSDANLLPPEALSTAEDGAKFKLDDILTTLREQYFIPARLPVAQQRLIYQKSKRIQLENSEATATIDGQEIELKPLDRQALIKRQRELIMAAISGITAEKRYEQLYPFLSGLAHLRGGATQTWLAMLVRRAAIDGQMAVVIHCLKAARATHLTLRSKAVFHSALYGIRLTAMRGQWSKPALDTTIRHSNRILALLADDDHMDPKLLPSNLKDQTLNSDLQTAPTLASWLEPLVVRAHEYEDGRDTTGQIKSLYERMAVWADRHGQDYKLDDLDRLGYLSATMLAMSAWQSIMLAQRLQGVKLARADALTDFARRMRGTVEYRIARAQKADPSKGTVSREVLAREYALVKNRLGEYGIA